MRVAGAPWRPNSYHPTGGTLYALVWETRPASDNVFASNKHGTNRATRKRAPGTHGAHQYSGEGGYNSVAGLGTTCKTKVAIKYVYMGMLHTSTITKPGRTTSLSSNRLATGSDTLTHARHRRLENSGIHGCYTYLVERGHTRSKPTYAVHKNLRQHILKSPHLSTKHRHKKSHSRLQNMPPLYCK